MNGKTSTLHKNDIALERLQLYLSQSRGVIKIRPSNLCIVEPTTAVQQDLSPMDGVCRFDAAGDGVI